MPIISDKEFEEFNDKVTELNNLTIDYEDLEESYTTATKRRNLFLILALFFLVVLIVTFVLKNLKPELFINKQKLEAQGLTLVKNEDYQALKDIEAKNQLAEEIAEEDPNYSGDEESPYEDDQQEQSSIANTTVYAVQIGAFVNNNIEIFSDSFTQFKEFQEGEFYKYSLGAFETLEEAQEFREKVITIGFNDAFVASYINGERQSIEEAY